MLKRLVVAVLVVLAVGLAVPSSRAEIVARTITPVMDEIGRRLAPGRLEAMADQLDARLSRGDRLPTGEGFTGWLRRDYSGPETDPWETPWYIQAGRRAYTVGSAGPDQVPGNEDDITVRRNLPDGR